MTQLQALTPWLSLSTPILQLNKQIHDDTYAVLWYSDQSAKIAVYSKDIQAVKDLLKHSQITFVSIYPTRLAQVTRLALDFEICEKRRKLKRCGL